MFLLIKHTDHDEVSFSKQCCLSTNCWRILSISSQRIWRNLENIFFLPASFFQPLCTSLVITIPTHLHCFLNDGCDLPSIKTNSTLSYLDTTFSFIKLFQQIFFLLHIYSSLSPIFSEVYKYVQVPVFLILFNISSGILNAQLLFSIFYCMQINNVCDCVDWVNDRKWMKKWMTEWMNKWL